MAMPTARTRALARLGRPPGLMAEEEFPTLPPSTPSPEEVPSPLETGLPEDLSMAPTEQPPAPAENGELAALQAQARRGMLAADIGRAGAMASEAISGARAPMELYANLEKRAEGPVRDYAERMRQRQASAQAEQEAALRDPFSAESKRRQAAFTRANPALAGRLGLTETPYAWADLEAVVKGTMPADMLAARATDQEQRAQALALQAEAEKRRAGTEEQGAALRQQELAERARQANMMDARGWAALSQEKQLALMRIQAEKEAREAESTSKATTATQKSVDDLRKEFEGNQVVKDYRGAGIALDKVRRAAKDSSAAGDLALVFALMKTFDPTSAVRETEFANAENAKGVPDLIRSRWNKVKSGERLTPEQRAEFVRVATSQFAAHEAAYENLAKQYEGIAPAGSAGRVVLRTPSAQPKRVPAATVLTTDTSGQPTLEIPPVERRQYSPSLNKTRVMDATGKVIRVEEGDTRRGR